MKKSVTRLGVAPWSFALLLAQLLRADPPSPTAQEVLRSTGIMAGLAVHVGTTDGALEAGLTNGGKMLVHGLALSDEAAAKARSHLFAQRLYGLASVARVESARTLPYYDRLVNLVVADLDALGEQAPPMHEILRVVGYGGVAWLRQNSQWAKTVRETSRDVDAWTHFAYDASRNSVSKDMVVGPPNAVRWLGGATGRNPIGGGRASDGVFVHINGAYGSGKRGPGAATLPWAKNVEGTVLWARDANSGVLLWYRPISRGWGLDYGFAFTDAFVAAAGRVYGFDFTSEEQIALTAWNIRTGAIERVFEKALAFRKGDAPADQGKKLDWRKAAHQAFENSSVLAHEGKVVLALKDKVFAMDAASGDLLWKKERKAGALCHKALVSEDRLIVLLGKAGADRKATPYEAVEAWSLSDGRPLWRFTELGGMDVPFFQAPGRISLGCRGQFLLIGGMKGKGEAMLLLDARKGTQLWEVANPVARGMWTACIVGDEVWAAGYAYGTVLELATGKEKLRYGIPNYGTCSTHAATPRYFIHKTKAFMPIEQPAERGPRGIHYYLQRAISLTCAEKLCPSYGSVFQIAPLCVCEAHMPGTAAWYTLRPATPVSDGQRLRRGGVAPLGPVEPQAEALKSPGAFDWGKPEGVEALLWSYMRDHGSRLGNEGRRQRHEAVARGVCHGPFLTVWGLSCRDSLLTRCFRR